MAPFGGDHNIASRTQVFSLQHCIVMSCAVTEEWHIPSVQL